MWIAKNLEVVSGGRLAHLLRSQGNRFWAVDKIILAYFGFCIILVIGWWKNLPGAAEFLIAHLAASALLIYEVTRPNASSHLFHYWYPLPYVAAFYKEMARLIPAVRNWRADEWLANVDLGIWGVHPTVWLERIQTPLFTEFLQWVYTLFVPAVLLVAILLWFQRKYDQFRYYAFLIALGFLVSYVGYLCVPARGPRFLLAPLQHQPLRGLWLTQAMQSALDRLESAHYDCFPSGHTELTLLAWWGSRMISRALSRVYFGYTLAIIFATVYLRYHYTIDVFAGAAVAVVLMVASPVLYRILSGEEAGDWQESRSYPSAESRR
jgi:uncharacterized membrane protein (DUF485 family)